MVIIKSISSTVSPIFLISEVILTKLKTIDLKSIELKLIGLKTIDSKLIELESIELKTIDLTTNTFSTKKETRLKLRFRFRQNLIYFVVDNNYKRLCVSTFIKQKIF